MAVRLRNQREPQKILSLAYQAWYNILDLAELYGWNPLGAVLPGQWPEETSIDSYFPMSVWDWHARGGDEQPRLVLLEDALNLADALEQAFREYEPQRMPASYFLFQPEDLVMGGRPSIGALSAIIDLCRQGAFFIEVQRQRLNGA